MTQQLALFIDYQNLHSGARDRFTPCGTPMHECLVNPITYASRLVQRRNSYRSTTLAWTRVYRGRPNPDHQAALAGHVDRQNSDWDRDSGTSIITRPLDYRGWPQDRPREKGYRRQACR